ncbi:carbohydrate ABC transporter permease [Paenibacillus sp. MER 180]|uniref:Carbohydrate ABC transporter permease n=1 Tax=Paenibacillus popilliae TaxID=78057 RepID=A0ABY3AXF9_PAEPP|nr:MULTISPECIES: carbohydrate ABC transporter permease [unclassified Paenibacillus]MCM3289506.1 carbohydrate ABC transporter permease [Paenibacillus sp. MER 180]OBY77165.1 sugar ABC transporter ATP-binding protein [Paenibacillus sp. KS1]TQR47101.1 carbohydrate ABC transporter permease [Paenibacillus sp. SDF0028]
MSTSAINTRKLANVLSLVLLTAGSLIILVPLLWTISTSLKSPGEVFGDQFFPNIWKWDNYAKAVTAIPFFTFLANTLIILIPVLIGTVFSAALCAYGFARFKFRGKRILFLVLLATMMLPGQVTMIPMFIMFKEIGWVDTFLPLIIPSFFGGGAFNIFLIRQFMRGIPKDLDEAAFVDGATRWTIFTKVMLPLSKPPLIAVAIFTFMGVWNDFQGPLIYLNTTDKYTLALGLSMFKGLYNVEWNMLMAATILIMLPALIVFFAAQKYFIEGISISSAMKG